MGVTDSLGPASLNFSCTLRSYKKEKKKPSKHLLFALTTFQEREKLRFLTAPAKSIGLALIGLFGLPVYCPNQSPCPEEHNILIGQTRANPNRNEKQTEDFCSKAGG